MNADDWNSIKNFKPDEFAYPDKMGFEFMQWLDQVREVAGVPFYISSSFRSRLHNENVGGADDSAHTDIPCNAVDIREVPRSTDPNWNHTRFKIVSTAIVLGCVRIGIYANGSVHLDRTENRRPKERIWRVVGNI